MDLPCRFFVKIFEINYSPRIKRLIVAGRREKEKWESYLQTYCLTYQNNKDLEKENWLNKSQRYIIWLQLLQCVDTHNKHKDF